MIFWKNESLLQMMENIALSTNRKEDLKRSPAMNESLRICEYFPKFLTTGFQPSIYAGKKVGLYIFANL